MVGFVYRVILCYQVQFWMWLDWLKRDCWALAGVRASKITGAYMSLKIQVTKHSYNCVYLLHCMNTRRHHFILSVYICEHKTGCGHRTVLFWWNLWTLQGAPLTWIDGECLCRSTILCLLSHNCWAPCLDKHVCVFGTACTVQAGLKDSLVRHRQEGNLSWEPQMEVMPLRIHHYIRYHTQYYVHLTFILILSLQWLVMHSLTHICGCSSVRMCTVMSYTDYYYYKSRLCYFNLFETHCKALVYTETLILLINLLLYYFINY